MLLPIVLFIVGLAVLSVGAEVLVRAASRFAEELGVSPFIVGATIIAYGTSAPELIVSALASFEGAAPIALGNVVGSNLLNTGLILGLSALIYPIFIEKKQVSTEMPLNIGLTLLAGVMIFGNEISRLQGALLLGIFSLYIFVTLKKELSDRAARLENGDGPKSKPTFKSMIVYSIGIFIGLAGLLGGAKVMVDAAIEIAVIFGVSERIIGLTIVAIGTSLPELAAAVAAALKKKTDMAVGNLLGSNIFNLGLILGTASAIRPIPLQPGEGLVDMIFLAVNGVMIMFFLRFGARINRIEGAILCLFYAAFAASLAFL